MTPEDNDIYRRIMKKTLGIERLEDRKVLSSYSVEIVDHMDLASKQVEDQMRAAAHYSMMNLGRHVHWNGRLDLRINVLPGSEGGSATAVLQNMPDPKGGWKNATIHEMLTGIDVYPNHPDVGLNWHLSKNNEFKVYGVPIYFDPNPMPYVSANVPRGHLDFISVVNHEVAHGIGFQWGTNDFSRHVINMNGNYYFNGPETVMALGRPLPMSTFGGTHYGNGLLPDNPVTSGLMYQWGVYEGNRIDWGRLDFAVLKDVGLRIKSVAGLPLTDRIDAASPRLVLSGSSLNENLPAGTTVATVGTNQSSAKFTFQIVAGWDDAFRISGNRIVSRKSFDFESKSSYTIFVRMVEDGTVWTDVKVTIRINDVKEDPRLFVPEYVWAKGGGAGFSQLKVTGDNRNVTLVFFSRSAILHSTVIDPKVKVYAVKNIWGGTTLTMVGTPESLTRSLSRIMYRGEESSVHIQMFSNGKNFASQKINLRYA